MDSLPALGTAIGPLVQPTIATYVPLLLANAAHIRSTHRETFTYGPHARHQLDLYTPPSQQPSLTPPSPSAVLVFLYGGGLVAGSKQNPRVPDGLVYGNVGHFFASALDCPVVIPDYRLLGDGAVFPSGGEDVALVLDWVRGHFRPVDTEGGAPSQPPAPSAAPGSAAIPATKPASPLDVYILANSAGGIHLSTYLFAPSLAPARNNLTQTSSTLRLKSLIFLSVPFHFAHKDPSRVETNRRYFGPDDVSLAPLGLLRAAVESRAIDALAGVDVLVLNGTLDPVDEILVPRDDFVDAWPGGWRGEGRNESQRDVRGGVGPLEVQTMQGHNHISPVMSVGTGIEREEAWGWQVVDFIRRSA